MNVISKTDVTGTHLVIALGLGLPYGIYCVFLLYRFMQNFLKKKIICILFCVIIIISMMSQNIIYNTFLWCIHFYSFAKTELNANNVQMVRRKS